LPESGDRKATSPEAAAAEPERLLAALESGEITYSEVGHRVGAMLQHAHDWAEQTVSDASAEAARIRASAKATSKKVVADAEAEAIRIVGEAQAEAVRRIEHAHSRVDELKESVELARLRSGSLKARLQGALEQLNEHDYDIDLPPNLPELPELDVSETDDSEVEDFTDKSDESASPARDEVGSKGSE
jgi:cell division septum initiation protein DivIVA